MPDSVLVMGTQFSTIQQNPSSHKNLLKKKYIYFELIIVSHAYYEIIHNNT